PSYVRVRNLQNNKTVIVKVNDRGPFAKNRIIDLSYVAAKKLGINGTSRVEVSVINPSTHQPTNSQLASSGIISPPDKDGNQKVYLQMGVFSEKSNAEKIARSIEDHIQAPVQIKSDQHNNKLIYRVRVPVNASKADMMYDKLARLGKPMKILE
ncbi:MAG: RlpA-like double-psi beta-barrel domain-containing protein, partial [Gammaproteobacteria bacterium]